MHSVEFEMLSKDAVSKIKIKVRKACSVRVFSIKA